MRTNTIKPVQALQTVSEARFDYMGRMYKQERIKRCKRLSYACKLAAIIASDNRPGKEWNT